MAKRLLIVLTLILLAFMFWDVAGNYVEKTALEALPGRYVAQGPDELGAPNLVTAVVVTYRGLDTLGEVTVLFLSAIAVGLLLTLGGGTDAAEPPKRASEIVETAVEYLFPIVILLGVYIFANGHLTPGGGFQGGAVIASATLLLFLSLPQSRLRHGLLSATESLSGFGYVVIGVLGIALAGGFLDNRVLPLGEYGRLFSAGAIPVIYTFIGLKVGTELSAVLERFKGNAP
ncbi:MAG: sodium:proton antiporter [Gammaproteobacteria bacterium]|nr:sodium:proton antiporter [Gammaproteobacteria bacterium]MCP5299348.1 sodium:proton antiporter [Chromatiaceae bacterium]